MNNGNIPSTTMKGHTLYIMSNLMCICKIFLFRNFKNHQTAGV